MARREKKRTCPHCGRAFGSVKKLERHERKDHAESVSRFVWKDWDVSMLREED